MPIKENYCNEDKNLSELDLDYQSHFMCED